MSSKRYPMTATYDPNMDYPYRFRFDLMSDGLKPMYQIPDLKNMVNTWLQELEIDYIYRHGLLWCLQNEQDALMFKLRWS
jgi:hypothetical protein